MQVKLGGRGRMMLSSETGRRNGVMLDKALKTEYLILQRSNKG